jgi:hypothetical protein
MKVADLVDGTSYIIEDYSGNLFSALYSASYFYFNDSAYDFSIVRSAICTVDDFYKLLVH